MPFRNIPPFVLSLDTEPYYNHEIYPNHVYRRMHSRHHDALDLATLGLIARLGPHAHHLVAAKHSGGDGTATTRCTKNSFDVHLDVGLFQPEDLTVKIVDDSLIIEGKHEEREDDHGHISRHFVRRYPLPKGCDADAIQSTLTAEGALTVRVPKTQPVLEEKRERLITIQHSGPSEFFQRSMSQEQKTEDEQKQ